MAQKSQLDGCQYRGRGNKAVREAEGKLRHRRWSELCKVSQLISDRAAMLPRLPKSCSVFLATGTGGPIVILQEFPFLQPRLSPGFRLWQNFQCGWGGDPMWEFHISRCCSGRCATEQKGPFLYIVAQQSTKKLVHLLSNNIVAIVWNRFLEYWKLVCGPSFVSDCPLQIGFSPPLFDSLQTNPASSAWLQWGNGPCSDLIAHLSWLTKNVYSHICSSWNSV